VIRVASAAADRATYLRRPDLGRRLGEGEAEHLPAGPYDVVFVIADGLSSAAVEAHAVPCLEATIARLDGLTIGPIVLASEARVALGDAIGAAMGARVVAVLIGERPGLSSPDSLGIYLTWHPQVGRNDAQRNCISNVRPEGLPPAAAAQEGREQHEPPHQLGALGQGAFSDLQIQQGRREPAGLQRGRRATGQVGQVELARRRVQRQGQRG